MDSRFYIISRVQSEILHSDFPPRRPNKPLNMLNVYRVKPSGKRRVVSLFEYNIYTRVAIL